MFDISRPRKLQRNVCVQQIGRETLVYDEIRHLAFCLNPTSAAIWRLCDGAHTVTAMAEAATVDLQAPIDEELVQYALTELGRDGLLEAESVPTLPLDVSRRKLMRTLGAGGVAMLPVVAAIMAPTAAQAYQGCADCTSNGQSQAARRRALQNPATPATPTSDPSDHSIFKP
jgi:hypothetical protein